MKATNIIQQKNGQIYCIVDPIACLNQSQTISYNNLIECKYCKSIALPLLKSNKTQCPICRCYTDIPEDYCAIVPVTVPTFVLTNQKKAKKSNKNKNIGKQTRLRLLIVCQAKLDQNFLQGLQCLQPILLNYQNMEICLITYGTQIRLVELEEDGRVITIHYQSMQLINDKFYPVSKQSISQIFTVLENNKLDKNVIINGSKLMVEVLEKLKHTDLVVLWLGTLKQSMQFYTYPSYAHTDIYSILKIPYTLTTHSQMNSLQRLNTNSTRVKYILRTDSPQIITQKVYYQLYEIFQHETVTNIQVQASRQRKYPPEILTCRSRVIGSLNNKVIIRMGKNIEPKERAQIRIKYTSVLQDEEREQQEGTNQQQKLVGLKSRQKILIINISFDNMPVQPNSQLCRYLRLYLFMRSYSLSSSIHQVEMMKINNDNDIDLCHFWKDSSFMQRAEIFFNLQNNHCIYAVWPLIGISGIDRKVMFIFYFTGYHICEEGQQGEIYDKQIEQLNQLCQILYCQKQKNPPLSYQYMIQQLNQSSHLNQSDSQQQNESNQDGVKAMKRYYEVLIK